MEAIEQRFHAVLALTMLAAFGAIPYFSNNMALGVFLFVYQYISISYVRWYLPYIEQSARWSWGLFLGGMLIIIASFAVRQIVPSFGYGSEPWKLPSMAAAFGLLLIANQAKPHHSRVINTIAASTLSVYLVRLYWPITMWLQSVMGAVYRLVGTPGPWAAFALYSAILALIYAVIIIDLIRCRIFAELNRHDPIKRKIAAIQ